jgi:G:T-mismatch repair DNA endonuclease (very short patch repair protein)
VDFLHANGFRYKLHDKSLTGNPDIALPKYKTVILCMVCKIVNGTKALKTSAPNLVT